MEATGAELNKSASSASEWSGPDAQKQKQPAQQQQPTPEGCNSAPPTTLQFESQSAATSLGYITNPSSARPPTPGEAKVQELPSEGDQKPESFEFERQQAAGSHDQHVPLTAPIDRSFDMSQNRFHFPQQSQVEASDGPDRRSPYLPPFRTAYSMPDRPYSDSYGRSPSPAMHQQPHSVPEAYGHPGFMHPAGYHYTPQQQNGSASVGAPGHPDMSAVPRMPPYPPGPHPADPYMRQHPGQMPAMSAPPPQFGSARPMMYPPQHHMGMPPPLSAPQPPPGALVRSRGTSDGSEEAAIERPLPPPGPSAAKPGQNQGTPFISKLMHLLSNDRYSAYIRWNAAGDAFILSHTNQFFASQVLPLYFRHSNTSSFIRQLNLYQFQRLPIMQLLETLDDGSSGALAGATAPSSCFSGFSHPLFKRDQEELSYMIKPKPGKVRDRSAAAVAARKAKQSEGLSPPEDSPQQQHQQPYQPPTRRATDIYKSEPSRRGLRSSKRLEHSSSDLGDGHEHELQGQQMMYPAYATGLSAQP